MLNFKDFKNYIKESFDSSYETEYIGKGSFGVDLYLIPINDKEYRMFIEQIDNDLHIGFERKLNNKWTISEITNDLSTKEVLGLFGTLIKVVKYKRKKSKIDSIYVSTEDFKKAQTYFNILIKVAKKINAKVIRDENGITLYFNDIETIKHKIFKYKKRIRDIK